MVFGGCVSLESVKLPARLKKLPALTFSGCTSLRSVEIPPEVTVIDDRAFQSCSALTELTVPEKVGSIGFHVFRGCTALRILRIPASLKECCKCGLETCTALETIELYGELPPKEQPVSEWLAELAFDPRSNAGERLLAEKRITPEMLDTSPKELYLNSVFQLRCSTAPFFSMQHQIVPLLCRAADRQTLNAELTGILPGDQIALVFSKFKQYISRLPAHP